MAISDLFDASVEYAFENQQALLYLNFLLIPLCINVYWLRNKAVTLPYKVCIGVLLCLNLGCICALAIPLISPSDLPAASDILTAALHNQRIPNVRDPRAADPQDVCPGYTATHVSKTQYGLTAQLTLAGKPCDVYGRDVEGLTLIVELQDKDRLHVEILPTYVGKENYTWFILPEELIPKPQPIQERAFSVGEADLVFELENEPSFWFMVKRRSTGDVLFTTKGRKIVYEDQFVEFGSGLPRDYNLYGLGETMHALRLGDNLTRTLFAADVGDVIDANLYGSHPFYLETRYFKLDAATGSRSYITSADLTSPESRRATYESYSHGLFNRNAHGQDILLRPEGITWRALGGTIDLYFYAGPSQDAVTKAYQTSTIGLPAMQQYWTFGYHQCRWGYKDWKELKGVLARFEEEEIPLETIWSDIDYMNAYRDFENDPVNYPYDEGKDFLERLHASHRHYVPIIDSAIYAPDLDDKNDKYPSFERGLEEKAFIMNADGSAYVGEVWPGFTVFPDWIGAVLNGTGAIRWWIDEVARYHDKINFDGAWVDMSEVSSFCAGSCGSKNRTYNIGPAHEELLHSEEEEDDEDPIFEVPGIDEAHGSSTELRRRSKHLRKQRKRNVDNPPYAIDNFHGGLEGKTVAPSAVHHGGYLDYDFHNLFGHQILNATYHALLKIAPNKRPFIIGRSQFAGSGKWAGHWGGDNYSLWAYLYLSIPQALSYSLFGFPMFGVDACGFNDDSNSELCSRWMQLSAFFPFYRNHNVEKKRSQEPYIWPEVAEATRTAMRVRYALLPYMYTTFYLSHSTGSATLRALSWEFPSEPWLKDADRQFLVGGSVMVVPCLVKGATTVDGVFPGSGVAESGGTVWYDWYSHAAVPETRPGENVTIAAPLGHIPVYVRGGHVLALQEPAMTTYEARQTPWSVLVALDHQGEAQGELYLDDGESLVAEETTWVNLAVSASTLKVTRKGNFVDNNVLGNVTVMGVADGVERVHINGAAVDGGNWNLDKSKNLLEIKNLDEAFKDGAWDHDWTLSWA